MVRTPSRTAAPGAPTGRQPAKSARKSAQGKGKGKSKGKGKGRNAKAAEPVLSRQEARALKRQKTRARKELISYLSAALGVAGVVGFIAAVLLEPLLGAGAVIGILCVALAYKYPRQGIFAFIAFLPFSGTVTYALGGSSILQLAKDAIYIPALIGVYLSCKRSRQPLIVPPAIRIPLAILLTFCTLTLLFVNGSQQLNADGREIPILLGVLGLKVLLGYLPLITCIYYLVQTRENVHFLLRGQVIIIIICCSLAFLQFLMLKTGICAGTQGTGDELFKATLEARCLVGGALLYTPEHGQIRLPGTFNAPWQWGWFLISSTFFAFGAAFSDRSPLWRLVGLIAMATVGVLAVISGQRIALALVPTIVIALLVLTGQIANLKRFLPIGIGLAVILTALIAQNPEVVNERLTSFQSRWAASPPQAFISEQFEWAQHQQEGILGRGVGRATNAARIFGETELVETYHPKLMYELGPLGLAATLGLYTALTIATFRAYRSIKDPNLRSYAACLWVFVLFISYFPYYYPLDVDPVNIYYWVAVGLVLKLPEIDQREQLEKRLEDIGDQRRLTKRELKQLKKQQNTISL